MKRKFMDKPLARPLTPRERRIRTKYSALFVIAALTALILAVYYNKLDMEVTELKSHNAFFDSLYVNSQYIETSDRKSKIIKVFEEADNYRDLHEDLFELTVNNGRYEVALESYSDSLMHEELYDRTGYRSKFKQSDRIKFIKDIKEIAKDCNRLIAYMSAFDVYREQNPAAVKDIEQFLFFSE